MIIIFDKNDSHLSLVRLIEELKKQFGLKPYDVVAIKKIGRNLDGVSNTELHRYESIIDDRKELIFTVSQLCLLAENRSNELQILSCIHPKVEFGVSDGVFIFVQSMNKLAESRVAKAFKEVQELPDRKV